ncbi:CDP-glycerol glycerophosphotransferase family protein, partial [Erwinia billingiae]|uniref:CDP-glycerol glycerophosphotransferase family protein n=1 Tax=Erwinia billingiae TaxID=182337 RepID=UPI00156ABDC9
LYIRSKYIVTTHNEMIGIKSNNQIYLSLWHGMPLKKIGYLADSEADEMESYSAQRIATSEIMRAIIASSFKEDASNVHVLGQPRNDYLFNMKNLLKPSTEKIIGGKNILYMPTFRKNTNNSEFSDGVEMSDDNFLRVLDFNLEEINRFLKNNNSRLYLKFHPFEEKLLPKDLESEQIKIITS